MMFELHSHPLVSRLQSSSSPYSGKRNMSLVYFLVVSVAVWCGEAHVCDIKYGPGSVGPSVNCSFRGLRDVPDDIPKNVVRLDLSQNALSQLKDFTFSNFSALTYLDLNGSGLGQMEPKSLRDLYNLTVLNLNANRLSTNMKSFPEGLFNDLKELRTLYLGDLSMASYPDWVFPPLTNLKELHIDAIRRPLFGPGFSRLNSLELVHFVEPCSIQEIRNNTFNSFRNINITTLVIHVCRSLRTIGKSAFEPLNFLTTLILNGNDIGLIQSLDILKPFVGRTMIKIDLSSVFPTRTSTFSTAFESFLTRNNTKYLTQICVRELSLRKNHIILIEEYALFRNPFMSCIENLDISQNNLLGDVKMVFMISKFSNLKRLSVGRQLSNGLMNPNSFELVNGINSLIILTLPPFLEYFDASGLFYGDHPYNLMLKNSENLKVFLFGHNINKNPLILSGLSNVEELDLSGDNLDLMMTSTTFFKLLGNVRTLSVHDCSLRFGGNTRWSYLNLPLLQYFDASRNFLTVFPVLPNPLQLLQLNLSANSFVNIPFDITTHGNLQILDMTFNSISYLDKHTRNDLDEAHLKTNLSVFLKGNTFTCGCENLDFILWLVEAPVVNETNRNFPCMLDNGTMTVALDVSQNFARIIRHCKGKFILALTVTFATLFLTVVSGTYIVAKNPTRYQNMILNIVGLGPRMYTRNDFLCQLYIGYCSDDIPFVFRNVRPALEKEGVKLFLKDREVLPGVDIADGIVEGINSSWKTLLVVSFKFLNDAWSDFTVNTVIYSLTHLIPNRIIILLLDDVQAKDLPETLLNAVDEDYILCKNEFEDDPGTLWEHLIEIGDLI